MHLLQMVIFVSELFNIVFSTSSYNSNSHICFEKLNVKLYKMDGRKVERWGLFFWKCECNCPRVTDFESDEIFKIKKTYNIKQHYCFKYQKNCTSYNDTQKIYTYSDEKETVNNCSNNCQNGTLRIYDNKCICSPGYDGICCEKTCPTGFYGDQCINICNCNDADCNFIKGCHNNTNDNTTNNSLYYMNTQIYTPYNDECKNNSDQYKSNLNLHISINIVLLIIIFTLTTVLFFLCYRKKYKNEPDEAIYINDKNRKDIITMEQVTVDNTIYAGRIESNSSDEYEEIDQIFK